MHQSTTLCNYWADDEDYGRSGSASSSSLPDDDEDDDGRDLLGSLMGWLPRGWMTMTTTTPSQATNRHWTLLPWTLTTTSVLSPPLPSLVDRVSEWIGHASILLGAGAYMISCVFLILIFDILPRAVKRMVVVVRNKLTALCVVACVMIQPWSHVLVFYSSVSCITYRSPNTLSVSIARPSSLTPHTCAESSYSSAFQYILPSWFINQLSSPFAHPLIMRGIRRTQLYLTLNLTDKPH